MQHIIQKVEKAGHKISLRQIPRIRKIGHGRYARIVESRPFSLDVKRNRHGEFFAFDVREDTKLQVLDTEGDHLLLLILNGKDKFKSLIGHDERQLFVAAIPEKAPVTSVATAKDALKPKAVRDFEKKQKVKGKKRHKRKVGGRLRQGDFFFIPSKKRINELLVLKNEPLIRGGGNPHMCSELYRDGGRVVYTNSRLRGQYSEKEYKELLKKKDTPKHFWRTQRIDMNVYVRGTVRHPEHATLILKGWHKVIPNTETQAKSMQHVVFLD